MTQPTPTELLAQHPVSAGGVVTPDYAEAIRCLSAEVLQLPLGDHHRKHLSAKLTILANGVEKTLTAAQAEADRLRVDALSELMNIACRELPDGYEVRLCAERGAGWVALFDHDGDEVEFDQDDLTLPERVRAAIHAAKTEREGR